MTDRQLLWGAGAVALVLAALTIAFSPALPVNPSTVPSTYSSAAGGARAAFLLLQELHFPVLRWEEPPAQLPRSAAMLVVAEPNQKPTERDKKELLRFVSGGGQLLFCGPRIGEFFPAGPRQDQIAPLEDVDKLERKLTAVLPSRWTRRAREIVLESAAAWGALGDRQISLYGDADGPAVVWWQIGQGQVLWWAAATPLTNAAISRAGNMQLLLNAVSPQEAGGQRTIYWDEYFHGERSSLWSYVEKTVLKWGIADLVLLAAVVVFAFGRRWGPLLRPRPVSRLSPLEFVETLGGLYERAGATSVPISVSYRHLKNELVRRLAMAANSSDRELIDAAVHRLGWDRKDLTDVLARAASGQSGKPRGREALAVVRAVEQYRQKLRPAWLTREESQ